MGPPAGTTEALAAWAAEAYRARPPAAVLDEAALSLTDTLACALAGAGLAGGAVVATVLEQAGGEPEAHSMASGRRIPAPAAAFVNATLANVADLDDNLLYHVHIACVIVPVALAVAEANDASTGELLAAIAIGYEVAARIALAHEATGRVVSDPPDLQIAWPDTFGHSGNAIGAAVAAGCLEGLDADGLRHAIGIAAYSAPVPSIAKSVAQPAPPLNRYAAYGWMAWSAVQAARLAAAGLTADTDALDGPGGFWRMAGSTTVDTHALTGRLGETWWIRKRSFKREPACSWARPALRALRSVLAREAIAPDDVAEVVIRTHLLSQAPMFLAREVHDYAGAQMSFPFAVAAVVAGLEEERWYDADAITDPAIHDLMARVRIEPSAAATEAVWEQIRDGAWPRRVRRLPTTVELRMRDGAVHHGASDYGDGDPEPGCRFGPAEVAAKFTRHAGALLGPDAAAAAAQRLVAARGAAPARELSAACVAAPITT